MYQETDKGIQAITCRLDGAISVLYVNLVAHYRTQEKVDELFAGGSFYYFPEKSPTYRAVLNGKLTETQAPPEDPAIHEYPNSAEFFSDEDLWGDNFEYTYFWNGKEWTVEVEDIRFVPAV